MDAGVPSVNVTMAYPWYHTRPTTRRRKFHQPSCAERCARMLICSSSCSGSRAPRCGPRSAHPNPSPNPLPPGERPNVVALATTFGRSPGLMRDHRCVPTSTIDLSADLAEGAPTDADLLALITTASVACGAHAVIGRRRRARVNWQRVRGWWSVPTPATQTAHTWAAAHCRSPRPSSPHSSPSRSTGSPRSPPPASCATSSCMARSTTRPPRMPRWPR